MRTEAENLNPVNVKKIATSKPTSESNLIGRK